MKGYATSALNSSIAVRIRALFTRQTAALSVIRSRLLKKPKIKSVLQILKKKSLSWKRKKKSWKNSRMQSVNKSIELTNTMNN